MIHLFYLLIGVIIAGIGMFLCMTTAYNNKQKYQVIKLIVGYCLFCIGLFVGVMGKDTIQGLNIIIDVLLQE